MRWFRVKKADIDEDLRQYCEERGPDAMRVFIASPSFTINKNRQTTATGRANSLLVFVIALLLGTPGLPIAEASPPSPVQFQVSRNTAMLSCWSGPHFEHFRSRHARSPIMTSPNGRNHAYAEVHATVKDDDCENTVQLFLSTQGRYQLVFQAPTQEGQDHSTVIIEGQKAPEVNGIRVVGWSPDERYLLAELTVWEYETDSGYARVPLLYDLIKRELFQPDVYLPLRQYYSAREYNGAECSFDLATEGFAPTNQLILKVARPLDNPYEEQSFCLNGQQLFSFDLKDNSVKRLRDDYQIQHNGKRRPSPMPPSKW